MVADMDTLSVIQRLKAKQGKMSLRAFAELVGCSAAYLSDIYLGRRTPGPKILDFLGLTVERHVVREYRARR